MTKARDLKRRLAYADQLEKRGLSENADTLREKLVRQHPYSNVRIVRELRKHFIPVERKPSPVLFKLMPYHFSPMLCHNLGETYFFLSTMGMQANLGQHFLTLGNFFSLIINKALKRTGQAEYKAEESFLRALGQMLIQHRAQLPKSWQQNYGLNVYPLTAEQVGKEYLSHPLHYSELEEQQMVCSVLARCLDGYEEKLLQGLREIPIPKGLETLRADLERGQYRLAAKTALEENYAAETLGRFNQYLAVVINTVDQRLALEAEPQEVEEKLSYQPRL